MTVTGNLYWKKAEEEEGDLGSMLLRRKRSRVKRKPGLTVRRHVKKERKSGEGADPRPPSQTTWAKDQWVTLHLEHTSLFP